MKHVLSALLVFVSCNVVAGDKMEEVLKTAHDIGIENYTPPATVTEAIKQSYDNRLSLGGETRSRVEAMAEIIQSEEFKTQQKVWRKSLASQFGVTDWVPAKQTSVTQTDVGQGLPYSERAILFISASMPTTTLKNYISDLEKVGGVMVMRGFVDGMTNIKPTMEFINMVTKRRTSCTQEPCERFNVPVLIDPILFDEYDIDRVPALTVHGLTNLAAYCNGTEGLNASDTVVYGDSSLQHLLSLLSEQEPTNQQIQSMISRL